MPDSPNQIDLFNWTGGLLDRRENPLAYPENGFEAGENFDIQDGALHTRPGCTLATTVGDSFESGTALLTARWWPAVCWDAERSRVTLFGGIDASLNSLTDTLAYDPETDEWTDLNPTDNSSLLETVSGYSVLVYAATTDLIWLWDGFNHIVLKYDPDANTWSELSTSGTAPSSTHERIGIWRPTDGCLWTFNQDSLQYAFKLNLGTGVWTRYETTDWASMTGMGSTQMVGGYDSVTDVMILTGGQNGTGTASYSFTTNTWTQKSAIPLGAGNDLTYGTGVCCSGKLPIVAGQVGPYGAEVYTSDLYTYDLSGDSWTTTAYESGYASRVGPGVCAAGDYGIFVCAGKTTVCRSDVWFLHTDCGDPVGCGLPVGEVGALFQARFPTNAVTYIIAQVKTGSTNALYAAPISEGTL